MTGDMTGDRFHVITSGRDVFTRGRYFFTRGRYFFTRGRYFFTSGRDVFRSELLGLFHHVIPQFVVLLEKASHSSGYSLFLCDSSFPEGMSGVLTDHSHQPRQNSFYDLSHHACKYIIVITVNEPSPLAPLTPALGAGGVGGVGCFLLVPIIIRARAAAGATAHRGTVLKSSQGAFDFNSFCKYS